MLLCNIGFAGIYTISWIYQLCDVLGSYVCALLVGIYGWEQSEKNLIVSTCGGTRVRRKF